MPLLTLYSSRYGDHLDSKGDFEGSMGCYLKTVGTVQASYVIRKVSKRSEYAIAIKQAR